MIASFDGLTPDVHPSAWIHSSAQVIGEVFLGEEANVWPTAVLRGDVGPIRIGAFSNLQDGAIAHATDHLSTTTIGARCTVGHRAILHGCTVEDDCLIGMGSILLDNCVIGAGSMVGAGAVVTMNQVVPPGVLVLGMPARVVRPLGDKERAWIRHSWEIYVKKAGIWKAQERG